MSVRLQDFHFIIKVDKASPDLPSPPPPPPPPPPSPLAAGDGMAGSGWADGAASASDHGQPGPTSSLTSSLAGLDILF
jgi:hypothetical protein